MSVKGRLYAYPETKEHNWVKSKYKQFAKVDSTMSMSKVIIALISEKMKDSKHKDWDPRKALLKDVPKRKTK
jgi:hypothetical protein